MMHHIRHRHNEKARHLLRRTGYKGGGKLEAPDDASEDRALIRAGVHAHEHNMHPGKAPTPMFKNGGHVGGRHAVKRLDKQARGGKAKHKGHTTNVMIAMPHPQPHPVPVPVPVGGARPPMAPPPGAAPAAPPPGAGPGIGAGPTALAGGIPGMGAKPPGMKSGGKAGGGYPLSAGGHSGTGRLEKAEAYGWSKGKHR